MKKNRIASMIACISLAFFCSVYAEPVAHANVSQVCEAWMKKSPHFKGKETPFVRKSYRQKKLEKRRFDPSSMPFYAIELEPEGFLIMNSDSRLPPVLAYSDTGSLNLDDVSDNAFRTLLKGSMERNYRKLMSISSYAVSVNLLQPLDEAENAAEWELLAGPDGAVDPVVFAMGGVTNGPFLTTTWNQNNHYNELCPEDSSMSSYYDGRVPVGCVAVVGAQIMNYYKWPYRGSGNHSYTDSDGSNTGSYSADFSDPFDWDNMQDDYYAWGSEPAAAVAAVSELMYETGVAVEMDYEADGSASYAGDLNAMMNQAFLYDQGTSLYDPGNSSGVADQIRAEIISARPAYVSISGHAIVADGHVDDGSDEYFHFNYGWGGVNDGWYLIDDIYGDPAVGCISGLYPAMIPVNVTESGATSSTANVSLEWALADVRTAEVQSVSVLGYILNDSTITDPAEDFSVFSITSTTDYKDWNLTSSGYSGDCFYKEPGGYSNREYHLTSIEKFIPQSGAQLQFRLKTYLASDEFRVMVSDDDGQTFAEAGSYDPGLSWTLITVDLSSFAGSEILIRFEYVVGSFYSSGGVWLDEISISGASWYGWETLQTSGSLTGTVVPNLTEGMHTLCLQAFDGAGYGDRSPAFSVWVESSDADGDGLPDDWETLYFGGVTNANPAAFCSNGVNTVLQAYIAGFDPTNPAAGFGMTGLDAQGRIVQWSAVSGRWYSVYWTDDLGSGFPSFPLVSNLTSGAFTDSVHAAEGAGFYRIEVELVP
jgi:hypothetical protein